LLIDVPIIQNWLSVYRTAFICSEECDIVPRSYCLVCFVALCAPVIVSVISAFLLLHNICVFGYHSSTVVKVLRYKSEGHWFDPRWCHGIFHWHKSFWSQYGPGVDSASNRSEYWEYFLGVNAAGV
jgi:hypothetical protein